jgi:hypothetical protein
MNDIFKALNDPTRRENTFESLKDLAAGNC